MAFGTVLTRKWQPPVPLLTFTARNWRRRTSARSSSFRFDPPIPMPTGTNVLGSVARPDRSGFNPPLVPGSRDSNLQLFPYWAFSARGRRVARMVVLDQTLSALQIIGVLLVIGSIWLGQRSNRTPRARKLPEVALTRMA